MLHPHIGKQWSEHYKSQPEILKIPGWLCFGVLLIDKKSPIRQQTSPLLSLPQCQWHTHRFFRSRHQCGGQRSVLRASDSVWQFFIFCIPKSCPARINYMAGRWTALVRLAMDHLCNNKGYWISAAEPDDGKG